MNKRGRLEIEARARTAIGTLFKCSATREIIGFPETDKSHEFDIFSKGIVIGGVSTSPYYTTGHNMNTGGCDRAASELLWLSLWQGPEQRIHVLTDRVMSEWLLKRYQGLAFPFDIAVYYYDRERDQLTEVGHLRF
jgi:hypothetical protein